MTGTVTVRVSTPKFRYTLVLERNITVIKDEGATGKSCLCALITEWTEKQRNKENTAVGVQVDCNARPITMTSTQWDTWHMVPRQCASILFIDEEAAFIHEQSFHEYLLNTDDYVVIMSHDLSRLRGLTFSVNSIKSLSGDTNKELVPWQPYRKEGFSPVKCLSKDGCLYGLGAATLPYKPHWLITEDSKTGYQFFSFIAGNACIPSGWFNDKGKPQGGKEALASAVNRLAAQHKTENILGIADGAAYGGELDNMWLSTTLYPNARYYLYESFEWLLLHTPLLYRMPEVQSILKKPCVNSRTYLSWERYFTAKLVAASHAITTLAYPKDKAALPSGYFAPNVIDALLKCMSEVDYALCRKVQIRILYKPLNVCLKAYEKNATHLHFYTGYVTCKDGRIIKACWFYEPSKENYICCDKKLMLSAVSFDGEKLNKAEALDFIASYIK